MITEVLPSLWILSEISVCVSISMSTISFTLTVLGVCANAAVRTNAGTTARARMFFISILPQSVDAEADLERIQNFRFDRCARLCGQLDGRSADTGRNAFQFTQRGLDEFGIRVQLVTLRINRAAQNNSMMHVIDEHLLDLAANRVRTLSQVTN